MTPQQVLALLALLANQQATIDAQSAEIDRLHQALAAAQAEPARFGPTSAFDMPTTND